MNAINRLLVIVQLLAAIALMPIFVVLLLFFRPGIANLLNNLGRDLVDGPNALSVQAICVGLSSFVFVVSVLLLFLELQRPSSRRLRVQQIADGQVEVTEDAIKQRLEYSVKQISEVVRVKPRVVATRKNAVNVFLELETSPEVNVPKKTQEVVAVAKQVLEEQMGLQVGKIQVQIGLAKQQQK